MPVDTSIYSLLRPQQPVAGPMDLFAKGMQIKALMGQTEMQDLQRQQVMRGAEEEQRIRDLFSGGRPSTEQVMAVSPTRGMQYAKTEQDRMASQQAALQKDDELVKSFGAQAKNELLAVTTPEAWEQWKSAQMQRTTLLSTPQYKQIATQQLQRMPASFDPNWIKATLSGGTPAPAGHTRLPGGGLTPMDPEFLKGKTAIAAAGAPQVRVQTFTPASEEAQKDFMKGMRTTYDQLKQADVVLENIDKAKALIPGAKGFMGPGGESLLETAKFLNSRLGMSVDTAGIKDAEELRTRVFYQIMENLKKMDAQPSQMQQVMMRDALGKLGTDPGALGAVLDSYGDVIRGKVEQHNVEARDAISKGVKFPYNPTIKLRPKAGAAQPAAPQQGSFTQEQIDAELRRRGVIR